MLVDGDDFNEPIADASRSILDGHIVLTRKLAGAGHYPVDRRAREQEPRARPRDRRAEQRAAAPTLARLGAGYREKEDLILVGAYHKGSDPASTRRFGLREPVLGFLRQAPAENSPFERTESELASLVARLDSAAVRKTG